MVFGVAFTFGIVIDRLAGILPQLIQVSRVSVFSVASSALWDRKLAPTIKWQPYRIVFPLHLVFFYVNIGILLQSIYQYLCEEMKI